MTSETLPSGNTEPLAGIEIRPECAEDYAAIHDLTERAFAPMPYAGGDEQFLIDALRKADALALSLVAIQDQTLVGHVAFSPAFPADGSTGWYTLGPVSVEPDLQRHGIGSQLIETGLSELRARGAGGCILVGNPDYYGRFGFDRCPKQAPAGDHAEFFQLLAFDPKGADCVIDFHPLFNESHAPNAAED